MGGDQLTPGASAAVAQPASRSADRTPLQVQSTTSTNAQLPFTTALAGQYRADVARWQARLGQLGYPLAADGHYGPLSAAAARHFQTAKGLAVDGVVGPITWAAAFA